MTDISATAVKSLRDRTGLPLMECKRALQETSGDEDLAVERLRKSGKKTMEQRAARETAFGRLGLYANIAEGVGALIELRCESAPVAANDEFRQLSVDLARQLATGPGAAGPDELLSQPSPSDPAKTLADQKDELSNRIREVFNLTRILRIDGPCGGYIHHDGIKGALIQIEGDDAEMAKQIGMHVVAIPDTEALHIDDLNPDLVAKEREILSEAARLEGKPENIIEKMVDGRMRNFYAERVLMEQPFVIDEKKTVGKAAKEAGVTINRYVRWEIGAE